MGDPHEPPLWTWGAALLLAAIVIGVFWAVTVRFEPAADAAYLNVERLPSNGREPPLVVFIGSSKTHCAVEPDSRFERLLADSGQRAKVVRFTVAQATARDFSQLFDRLPSTRPAMVAIESELVDLEPNPFRLPETPRYRDWRERMRHVVNYEFAPPPFRYSAAESQDHVVPDCIGGGPLNLSTRLARLATRRASTPAEREPYTSLARNLHRAGTRVILLRLPSRGDAFGAKPAALAHAERETFDQMIVTGLFEDIGNPPPMRAAEFIDYGHLGQHGQAKYSDWLARRIAAELGKRRAE